MSGRAVTVGGVTVRVQAHPETDRDPRGQEGLTRSTTSAARFGHLNYDSALRVVVPSLTALILSRQTILGTFFLSILGIRRAQHRAVLEVDPGSGRAMVANGQSPSAQASEPTLNNLASWRMFKSTHNAPIGPATRFSRLDVDHRQAVFLDPGGWNRYCLWRCIPR
jgi:hypothetical protein